MVQEWDYTVLTVADPLTKLLAFAETVHTQAITVFRDVFFFYAWEQNLAVLDI